VPCKVKSPPLYQSLSGGLGLLAAEQVEQLFRMGRAGVLQAGNALAESEGRSGEFQMQQNECIEDGWGECVEVP
jgi:hypothetical protein